MNNFRYLVPEISTLTTIQYLLYVLLFGILMLAILPFFLLIFYTHPSADDYCYANVFIQGDFWEDVIGEYMAWKGRYFGIFVTVLFHKSGSMIENYHYPLFLFLLMLFLGFYFFTRSVFEDNGPFIRTIICAFTLGVFYIVTMPKVSASLYWADGAFQYTVGSIFYLLSIASILKLYREEMSPTLPALLSSVFIFAAIGSTEFFMISLFTLVCLMFLYKFFILKQNQTAWLLVLAVTVASTLLLLLSPGNYIRSALQPAGGQFWLSITHSIYYGSATLGTWLARPLFWLLTILFIPVAIHLVYITRIRREANWIRLFLIFGLFLGQLWVSFFATWWAGATHPPGRALNSIYLIFLVGWFMFILEFVAVFARVRPLVCVESIFTVPVKIFMIITTSLFAILLVTQTHVPDAYSALFGPAKEYDHIMKSRYAYIDQARSASPDRKLSLSVQSVEDSPRILVFSDLSRDKMKWPNGCYATYFGLSAIDIK